MVLTMMTTIGPTSTSQTDGQTDRRTTCPGNTALRYASRSKNVENNPGYMNESGSLPEFNRFLVGPPRLLQKMS